MSQSAAGEGRGRMCENLDRAARGSASASSSLRLGPSSLCDLEQVLELSLGFLFCRRAQPQSRLGAPRRPTALAPMLSCLSWLWYTLCPLGMRLHPPARLVLLAPWLGTGFLHSRMPLPPSSHLVLCARPCPGHGLPADTLQGLTAPVLWVMI